MSEVKVSFTDAICYGHFKGLTNNVKSHILGLGVNYQNGADGTTKNLAVEFPSQLHDTPVSEAAFTGMAVGMGTNGLNPIVHHGRVEFALLAMDQVLTQAAKWEFMFGGDYPCNFAARLNIGRQWGNGPQHTSSYNSLFLNTPGIDIFWPSRPSEAAVFTEKLHHVKNATLSMEHRYLFRTLDNLPRDDDFMKPVQTAAIYGGNSDTVIITYGDGLGEALKVKDALSDCDVQIVCLTAFMSDRKLSSVITEIASQAKTLICIDTSNYQYGLMQSTIGMLAEEVNISGKLKIFSPPFTPCATSPLLVKEYYPKSYKIVSYLNGLGITKIVADEYSFDEHHLPLDYDFSGHAPSLVVSIESK